jgi:hypothetical protein
MQHPTTSQGLQKPKPKPVQITGAKATPPPATTFATITAKVHDDRRLCIPRSAFEMYVHFTGQPMRGGDPVFVTISPTTLTVTLDDPGTPGTKRYDLATTRGRVLIPSPNAPFTAGDAYGVAIADNGLSVDITATI